MEELLRRPRPTPPVPRPRVPQPYELRHGFYSAPNGQKNPQSSEPRHPPSMAAAMASSPAFHLRHPLMASPRLLLLLLLLCPEPSPSSYSNDEDAYGASRSSAGYSLEDLRASPPPHSRAGRSWTFRAYDGMVPNARVGFDAVEEKALGDARFLWERPMLPPEAAPRTTQPPAVMAQLTPPAAELRRLRHSAMRIQSSTKVGGAGVTREIVDKIWEKWKMKRKRRGGDRVGRRLHPAAVASLRCGERRSGDEGRGEPARRQGADAALGTEEVAADPHPTQPAFPRNTTRPLRPATSEDPFPPAQKHSTSKPAPQNPLLPAPLAGLVTADFVLSVINS